MPPLQVMAADIVSASGNVDRRKIERLPAPRCVVRPRSVDALRRVRRWNLRDLSRQLFKGEANIALARQARGADHSSGQIVRVGLGPELDCSFVNLRLGIEKRCESRRATDEEDQQACRERIEGAQMSNAALAVDSPYVLNDVVRRHPRGLVDEQQSLDWRAVLGRSISLRLVHWRRWNPAA